MVGGSTGQKRPRELGMSTGLSQAWDWHWSHLPLRLQVPFLSAPPPSPRDRRQLSLGTGSFVESWSQQLSRPNLRPPCLNKQVSFHASQELANELTLWSSRWRYEGSAIQLTLGSMLRPDSLCALQVAPSVTSCGRCVKSCRAPHCHCSCSAPALLSTRTR